MSEGPYVFAIPLSWAWVKVSDITTVIRGASPRPKGDPRYFGGNIPWIMISDVSREPGKYLTRTREGVTDQGAERSRLLEPGALILSNSGTVCVPKILAIQGCIHDGFVSFPTLSEAISKDFLYHWFDFIRPKVIQANKQGITQVNLNTDIVRELDAPVPPSSEQRRIVAKIEELFSDLDAGVAALKRAKANLKRYRAAVLKAAVEGKLTEDWRAKHPNTEPASKLLARILAERRQKWEADQLAKFAAAKKAPPMNWREKYVEPSPPATAQLPELPKGWCWATVAQLLSEPTCNGISIKGTDTPPGVPALRLNAMTTKGFDYNQRRYIPISSGLASALAIRSGDLFVSRGNGSLHLVGRGVLAQEPPEVVVFPDTMIRVTLIDTGKLRRFVSNAWSSRLVRRQIETKARTTAGIYKISQRDVEGFVLPIPSAEEQDRIVEEIDETMALISVAERQVDNDLLRASRLRQSILKQAFEGKLVPQDPQDEPASALLERLRSSRSSHEANGKAATTAKSRGRPVKSKKVVELPKTRLKK